MRIGGYKFHPRFVRENLLDEKSWDASSRQRLCFGVSPDIQGSVEQTGDDGGVKCRFEDGSVGSFAMPPGRSAVDSDIAQAPKQSWPEDRKSFVETMRAGALDFSALEMVRRNSQDVDLGSASEGILNFVSPTERTALRNWIEALHRDGVALVKNMPAKPGALKQFAETIFGYVLPTAYGQTFTIRTRSEPNNLAYSNLGLQLHTDLPYYDVPPAIQLFHCIQQARLGGGNVFADGFAAAQQLRAAEPDMFAELSSRAVRFQDSTPAWELRAEHRLLELGSNGTVTRVHFNERARDSWSQWRETDDVDDVDCFYRALSRYEIFLEDPENAVHIKLQPGEMSVIDNWRVLHSREGFEGERWLEGGYVSWDQAHSLWRVLKLVS